MRVSSSIRAPVVHEERRILPDAHLPEPVGPELRDQEIPHRDGDVLRRRHAAANQRVGTQVGVVEAVDHGLADDSLQLREIDDHARLRIDGPAHGDVERVVVSVRDREPSKKALVLPARPFVHPVAVGRGEREPASTRRAGLVRHGSVSRKRRATRSRPYASTRWVAVRPKSRLRLSFISNVSSAVASSAGLLGLTRKPVRRSSTISGTAAARQATTGSPAAIASAKTSPNPSWTVGRQKQWALAYSTASVPRLTSPSRRADSPKPRSRWTARSRADSGPSPTMRTWAFGIRCRSRATACRRSSRRLRGYMRATESTVGRAADAVAASAKRRRHSSRSIGSGTTASLSSGMP